ncbi:GNAT family N-acetyltransferase [Streptacidiphilus albus]|uniref:GNAT family N-acetyltransferase n=1 Tax=Streptacidiphilus albus TaxID=105425 RepID=UPI0009E09023
MLERPRRSRLRRPTKRKPEPLTAAPPDVTDVPGAHQYQARYGEALAGLAQYLRSPGLIAFVHTEVDPRYEGRGVGSALVRTSLDRARADGDRVLAVCPFYAAWIARHPDYQDLLHTNRSQVTD